MKKKALILIEDISYTFDNRVRRETDALTKDGWDITVVCPKDPTDPFYQEINNSLRVYFYPKKDALSTIGHILEHSITIISTSLIAFWVLVRHGFFVIQACNPMDIFWIVALPYKLFGMKFVFDHHDLSPELYLCRSQKKEKDIFYGLLIWLEKMSFKFADVVISTNESYKKIAIERGRKSNEKVFVVRNGPDLNKFKKVPARIDLKKEGEILIGYLGNMNPQDGVDYLIKAAQYILSKKKISYMKFVFVGRGSYQPILAEKSVEMGLKEYVIFTGRLPDDEMLATLCACDICVQPDPLNPLNDKSTMNKVMEYMALGKPVVAFDLKETRYSCGNAAMYVTPNDPIELAEKIIYLANNPDVRIRMARIGRERIENKLSWEYSIPYLLKAYESVIQK